MKTKKLLLTIMVFLFAAAVFLGGAPLQTSAADEIVLTMEIRTAAQLANLAALVNAGNLEKELLKNLGIPESDWAGLIARGVVIVNIKLMNDIDLSAYTNWTPIGSYQNCFTATFDGNGRKITGLNVNNTNANEAGLFGYVLFGTVKNLNVEGASIRGRHYIGGIVGWLDRSNIENCSFSGTIGGRDAVGGVAGWVTSGSELNYCSSLGGAISGNDGVGGVAGALFGKMTNCASTSTVTGMGKYVGGVVGTIETLASVSNSRATGKVTGKDYVGGIVGAIEYGSKVVSCYATGAVVGDRYVGGITGYASMRGPASVDHSVALNPSVTANISNAGRVVGLTNQNSFAGGDYTENYLENNAAISLMVVTINGVEKAVLERDFWELVNFGGIRDADWVLWGGIDGADIYPSGVTAGGTVGGRFTAANGWTTANGRLPGFGQTFTIPGFISSEAGINPFEDIFITDWCYNEVVFVYERRIMIGMSTTSMVFETETEISRGMILTVLYRLAGSPSVSGLPNPFNDVFAGDWYEDPIKWALSSGITVNDGSNKTFGPNDVVPREELVVMLYRFENVSGLIPADVSSTVNFLDLDDISPYAREAAQAIVKQGIIIGMPGNELGNYFDPQGNTTRAQFATVIYRFLNAVE